MLVKLDHFPRDRGENKNIFELPPPSEYMLGVALQDTSNSKFRLGSILKIFHNPGGWHPCILGGWIPHPKYINKYPATYMGVSKNRGFYPPKMDGL